MRIDRVDSLTGMARQFCAELPGRCQRLPAGTQSCGAGNEKNAEKYSGPFRRVLPMVRPPPRRSSYAFTRPPTASRWRPSAGACARRASSCCSSFRMPTSTPRKCGSSREGAESRSAPPVRSPILVLGAFFSVCCLALAPGTVRDIFFQLAFGAYLGGLFNLTRRSIVTVTTFSSTCSENQACDVAPGNSSAPG